MTNTWVHGRCQALLAERTTERDAARAELEEVRADLSKAEKQLDDWRARAQGRQSLLDDARTAHSEARAELARVRSELAEATRIIAILVRELGGGVTISERALVDPPIALSSQMHPSAGLELRIKEGDRG